MSLKKYSLIEKAKLHLLDATGNFMYLDDAEKQPVTIDLYGVGSKQYQEAERRRQDAFASKLRRYKNKTIPSEELEEIRIDFLVGCVAGSENFNLDGLEGDELYRTVFTDRSLVFITDQVERFIGDQANFMPKPLTN
jgi:hypothetical protein